MTTEAGAPGRVRGMNDLLPDDMDRVRAVEAAFAAACRAWGYREVRTPVIEPLYLFTAAGTLSPRTLDAVYSFLDWDGWSGERVVLRPDSTIPAARLYAEHYAPGQVARLFYRQNVFRFTDDGSSREEWQCGVELVGESGLASDAELVSLALETIAPLGLPETSLLVSHAGIVRAVLAAAAMSDEEQTAAYDRLLDGDMIAVEEIERRLPALNAPLRLLFDVEGSGSQYLANIRSALVPAIPGLAPPMDELGAVVEVLEARGVAPVVQAVLARSFEYYSGLVFKVFSGGQRIISGGRYDGLLALVGGAAAPASGFAVYVTPVASLMSAAPRLASASNAIAVQPASLTPSSVAAALDIAAKLRAAGLTAALRTSESAGGERTVTVDAGRLRLSTGNDQVDVASIDALIAALERGP